jgi:hypothetical protein
VLDYAAKDKKVRGLMANVGTGSSAWTMSQAQEIRQASQQRQDTEDRET